MKFLFLTDLHITSKRPASRIDDFEKTIYKKLLEVGSIIKSNNIDFVIIGGDMFHTPKINLKTANCVAQIIRSWQVPVHSIIGNHDVFGYNETTLNQTILGLFKGAGIINLINREKVLEFNIDGKIARIEGQNYYADIDKGNVDDYNMRVAKDFNIIITHSMLLDKPFFKEVPHTLVQEITSNADLVLCGHYHPGLAYQISNGTKYYNPGSMIRVESNRKDIPKVSIIEVSSDGEKLNSDLYEIELSSALPREEVFDTSKKEEKAVFNEKISDFKDSVDKLTSLQDSKSLEEIVTGIGNSTDSLDDIVISELALEKIEKAQININDKSSEFAGYETKNIDTKIVSVEIVNFQSYDNATLNLTDGINTIIGESGHGKTAIERAIRFALYDEPKGRDFIRKGEKSCSVKVNFSTGCSITRTKSNSSSGKYVITDQDGKETEFKGFGNNIPIEVANIHKSPKVEILKDKKISLNFATQLETSFLLTESPLAKAEAIGKLTGAHVVDAAIKECSKELNALNKDLKALNVKKKDYEAKLEKYSQLDSIEKILEYTDGVIGDVKTSKLKIEELNKNISTYNGIENKISISSNKIKNYKLSIVSDDLIKKNKMLIEELKSSIANLDRLIELKSKLYKARENKEQKKLQIDLCQVFLAEKPILGDIQKSLLKLDDLIIFREKRVESFLKKKKLNKEITNNEYKLLLKPTINKINSKVDILIDISDNKDTLEKKKNANLKMKKEIAVKQKQEEELKSRALSLRCKIKKLIDDTEKCPVCNSILNYDSVMSEGEI